MEDDDEEAYLLLRWMLTSVAVIYTVLIVGLVVGCAWLYFTTRPALAVESAEIHDCQGGLMPIARDTVIQMNKKGEAVRLSGYIASSCTMYLAVKNACYAEDSVFYFHNTTGLFGNKVDNRDYFRLYLPPRLFAELEKRGAWGHYGIGSFIALQAKEVAALDIADRTCHD